MASLGILQGFRGRADEEFKRRQDQDAKRREQEYGLYNYLMASRDPEIRAMAMHGLYQSTQPSPRKGGWGGLMGEIETSSVYPQIRQLAESWVPDEPAPADYLPKSSAPSQPPAQPGTAAMAPDSPVEPGAAPMPPGLLQEAPVMSRPIGPTATDAELAGLQRENAAMSLEAQPGPLAAGQRPLTPAQQAAAGASPPLPGMPGVPMPGGGGVDPTMAPEMPGMTPPGAPAGDFGPVGGLRDLAPPQAPPPGLAKSWHRRGTGVPTAEEIAEYNARIPTETRIGLANKYLSPADAQKATMGILGAPQAARTLTPISAWGIKLPNGQILPALLDQNADETGRGGYRMPDGGPIPPGATMVRMGGGNSGGLTTKIPDSDEGRAYLLAQGVDPAEIAMKSPSGYWKIVTRPDGTVGVQADMYTPPPAYSGTTEITDPAGVAVKAPILRGGGTGPALGDVPNVAPTEAVTQAQGLLKTVDQMARDAGRDPVLGGPRAISAADRDAIVLREAKRLVPPLPYQTYAQLQQAAAAKPETTPRQRAEGSQEPLTMAQKVRATALRLQQERRQNQALLPGPAGSPPGTTIATTPPDTPPSLSPSLPGQGRGGRALPTGK